MKVTFEMEHGDETLRVEYNSDPFEINLVEVLACTVGSTEPLWVRWLGDHEEIEDEARSMAALIFDDMAEAWAERNAERDEG